MAPNKDEHHAILMVDDEPIILISLRQELRKNLGSNFDYLTATDGETGLELIHELQNEGRKVILVVSDWLMPGMRGDELIRKVRKAPPAIRTILLSGMADDSTVSALLQDGTLDAYIQKPWSNQELLETCRKLIQI